MGASVKVYDPISMKNCRSLHPELGLIYCDTLEQLAKGSDALILVTEWAEFTNANWRGLVPLMKSPLVIDGRNALSEKELVDDGAIYRGIGH